MIEASWAGIAVSAVGVVVTSAVSIGGTIWALRGRFETVKDEARSELESTIDIVKREFGEVATALRRKVEDVEFWARDTIIQRLHALEISVTRGDARNEAVLEAIDRFGHVIDTMDKKIDARFTRIENKIDDMPRHGG